MSIIIGNIDTKDISVVVQGAISPSWTRKCLLNIRSYLPGAEIILSTWENSITDNLDYDIIVKSADPGDSGFQAYLIDHPVVNNGNRQIVSTQEGIKKASRKYILKIRTDFYLESNNFLKHYDSYNFQESEWKIFSHRVIVSSVFSRNFSDANGFPLLFHPSDFFFFGKKEDICDFFLNTPLMKKEEGSDWDYKYPNRLPYSCLYRYTQEEYLCYSWVKRHKNNIDFQDFTDWSTEKLEYSNNILFNNFIFLDPKQITLAGPKHEHALNSVINEPFGFITYKIFLQEYTKRFGINENCKE